MSFWTALFLIACVIAVTEAYKARTRSRAGILADEDGNETYIERRDPELQREVEELRERVKVLERIAYDANSATGRQSQAISAEIEKLRDNETDRKGAQ